jgi:hypothetical protein
MITHNPRCSLPRGNTLVPSRTLASDTTGPGLAMVRGCLALAKQCYLSA